MTETVDIMCAVLNGEAFLADFFRGLEEQTHREWRLWMRDDGSTDRTVEILREYEARDSRIRVIHVGGPKSGATKAYAWLLEHLPADARYVMFADADDVWFPPKISRSLETMFAEEARVPAGTPVLVHTDMVVVDAQLKKIHPSFWEYSGFDPEPATLRRLVVRNVVAGQTMLLNRALCERIGSMPDEAIYHDGWGAIVAAATGRIVALRDKTLLYRQHGTNTVGAGQSKALRSVGEMGRAVVRGMSQRELFRQNLGRMARQAAAVEARYGAELSAEDRAFLSAYARIPQQPLWRRKVALLRLHVRGERGMLHDLGALLRG